MNDLNLFNYNGQPVRTLIVDGEPGFIANDLCAVLELANPRQTLSYLDDDEKGVTTNDTLGGAQQMAYVTEAGMYSLVLRSRKPEAKVFKRWVTHEVLPQIRKTGSYGNTPALTGKELLAAALLEAQATMAEKDFQIQSQSRQLEAAAPKVAYVDQFVADDDLLKFRTVAANAGIGEQALRELLIERRWIYRETTSRWSQSKGCKETITRYSAYADKKPYFHPVMNHEAPRFKGEVMHTLKVTAAGAAAIARLLARADVAA